MFLLILAEISVSYHRQTFSFSPDGKHLLFTEWEAPHQRLVSLWIYDISCRKKIFVERDTFRYSEGGCWWNERYNLLGMGWYDDTIFYYSINGEEMKRGIVKGEKVEIHKEFDMLTREEKVLPSIHHISFSFDRHYMAFIYGFEEPSFLYLYEIDKKKLKQISPAGKNVELSGYAWSPSGDVIAVGYQRLKLVDVTTQQEIFTIDSVVNKGTGGIFVLEWNKNGLLYAKTEDGLNNAFFVWDGREKKAIKDMARWVINGRTQRIEKISFNEMDPEKREIFFSPDSTVFIYLVEKPIDTMRGIFKTHLYLERRK